MVSKRKGFTLVELLIVIIVIGILVGGMLLASGSASDSARAATLLSDLRNAKAAGVLWMADHPGSLDTELAAEWLVESRMRTAFIRYMDNRDRVMQLHFRTAAGTGDEAGVTMFLIGRSEDTAVLNRAIRQNAGVLFQAGGTAAVPVTGPDNVFMRVK